MNHHNSNDVYVHNDGMTNLFLGAMAWSAWSANERAAEAHERTIAKEKQMEQQLYRIGKHILALPPSTVSAADRIRAQVIVEDYEAELARQKRQKELDDKIGLIATAIILLIVCWVAIAASQSIAAGPVEELAPAHVVSAIPVTSPTPAPIVPRAQLVRLPHHHAQK